jgi:hypothetical protein
MSDNQELNELLAADRDTSRFKSRRVNRPCGGDVPMPAAEERSEDQLGNLVQWTTGDNRRFVPASNTKACLIPGVYEIQHSPTIGIYFEKIPVKTEGLLRFPQTNSDKVVKEIQTFWDKEDIFRQYKLTYKRGIILWGPPGSGKSCTIQLIMKDVVDRDGIVVKFNSPSLFLEGMRIFREIEPKTPAVILMEDIDSTLEIYNESEVLNILDGVDQVEKIVFLATTNYPERLGARILNRPSRFDKRFKIGHPNPESRMMYFKHLIGEDKLRELKIDLKKWVKDTEGFSIAHLKELFVAVVILGDNYSDAIETLSSMKEIISSDQDRDRLMGFNHSKSYGEEKYGACG